jgi:hypothetical protein
VTPEEAETLYPKKVLYLAGPYNSAPEENYQNLLKASARMTLLGHTVICPILMLHPMLGLVPAQPHEFWSTHCLKMLERCDRMFYFPDATSQGLRDELDHAFRQDIPTTEMVLSTILAGFETPPPF